MAFTNIGSSASSGVLEPVRFFYTSTVWTCEETGLYQICILGSGGSGGIVGVPYSTVSYPAASGGGGGGFCLKNTYITKTTSLTLSIGSGGAANSLTPFVVASQYGMEVRGENGNVGGTTSVIGGNVYMVVTGGGPGLYTTTMDTWIYGGVGGVASGGDLNRVGGNGGPAKTYPIEITKPSVFYEYERAGCCGAASSGGSCANIYANGTNGVNEESESSVNVEFPGLTHCYYNNNIFNSSDIDTSANTFFPFMMQKPYLTIDSEYCFCGAHGYGTSNMDIGVTSLTGPSVKYGGGSGGVCYNGFVLIGIDILNSTDWDDMVLNGGHGGDGIVTIQRIG